MKKVFIILFVLVLVVSLGLVTTAPILAGSGWTDIIQVAAGGAHTVGLRSDGTVISTGSNECGQCNVGDWTRITQVAAGGWHTVGLKEDRTVVAVGAEMGLYYGQCEVDDWTDIIQVAAGPYQTVGLKSDGTVVAVGWDNCYITAVGDWTNIVKVVAGDFHTVGLKTDGTVVAVGCGPQCDVGGWTGITQIAAGQAQTVGLKSDGTVVAVGDDIWGQCDVGGWTGIDNVSAGHCHTVGLKSDGTAVAVGDNSYGQCNVGGWTDITQVSAGGHTVGLKSDGTVVAVGDNSEGQCNVSGEEEEEDEGVTEPVIDDIVDAKDEADTEVEVDGIATVTVFPYDENPGGPAPTDFTALGKYIDVYVPDTTEVTEIEIRLYYTDAELTAVGVNEETLRLFWWDGYDWVQCSDSGVNTASTNGYSGYMWAIITEHTTPSLEDLQGTEFGGYGHPSTTPQPCGCFIATATYGTDTAEEIAILREFRDTVLLPNSLGARFVSLYYQVSPPIASVISQHEVLRTTVRVGLVDPIVKILGWTHDLWSTGGSQL